MKQIKVENCDVVGYKCFKSNSRDLAVSGSEKYLAWKEQRLLNVDSPWDKEGFVLKESIPTNIWPQPRIYKKECEICSGQIEEKQKFWNNCCCD